MGDDEKNHGELAAAVQKLTVNMEMMMKRMEIMAERQSNMEKRLKEITIHEEQSEEKRAVGGLGEERQPQDVGLDAVKGDPPPAMPASVAPHARGGKHAAVPTPVPCKRTSKTPSQSQGCPADKADEKPMTRADGVRWDPSSVIADPQLKRFFDTAGVSERQLQDPQTREFIIDFIKQRGGFDVVD